MYGNKIGDNGMMLVVDRLQCNNTFTKLDVGSCGLSMKGAIMFKTEFTPIQSLRFLYSYIWSNKIRLMTNFSVEVTTGRNTKL